jgi:hypothetical protein
MVDPTTNQTSEYHEIGKMGKTKVTGFSLLPEHLEVIDSWCTSTGMTRSKAIQLAVETLADYKIEKDRFRWRFTEPESQIVKKSE